MEDGKRRKMHFPSSISCSSILTRIFGRCFVPEIPSRGNIGFGISSQPVGLSMIRVSEVPTVNFTPQKSPSGTCSDGGQGGSHLGVRIPGFENRLTEHIRSRHAGEGQNLIAARVPKDKVRRVKELQPRRLIHGDFPNLVQRNGPD